MATMSTFDGVSAGDQSLPSTRPIDASQLLDNLHASTRRLEVAFFTSVATERAYESRRADLISHYVKSESMSAAEKYTRADPTLADLAHRHRDAQADLRRWEAVVAHWRFLVTHTPMP